MTDPFERGVVVVSIDTEQIWGYLDFLNEAQFEAQYPEAPEAHDKLLGRLCAAGVGATWFVVGALALDDSAGAPDGRICGLAHKHARVPGREEPSARLWYCRPFLERLRRASPAQEIGLHGGMTHMVWTEARATRELLRRELFEGIAALEPLCGQLRAFSYPRNQEAYFDLLLQHGIRYVRASPQSLAWRVGRGPAGAVLRAWEEVRRAAPLVGLPVETIPGIWSIPSSMFLYPIGAARTRVIGLGSRVERFRRGVEAAARHRRIFHFSFHPENLVESAHGFPLLDDLLEILVQARGRGDVEVMTMRDVVCRMERKPDYDFQKQQQYAEFSGSSGRS